MCKAGNQTIYRECMMLLKSGNGGVMPPKDERRQILDAKGGCIAPTNQSIVSGAARAARDNFLSLNKQIEKETFPSLLTADKKSVTTR